MKKRFEENTQLNYIEMVEDMTGKSVGAREKKAMIRGSNETDLVNSGLEDTMIEAYHAIKETQKRTKTDLRTAAFTLAITKVGWLTKVWASSRGYFLRSICLSTVIG